MKKRNLFSLVLLSLFLAIIIVQSFVPNLGNITLFVIDITIIHITVMIGGIVLGKWQGAFLGLAWGICSFIRAYTGASLITFLIFTNPLISIVPRVLVGLIAVVVYEALSKENKLSKMAMASGALVGSLTNTVVVLSLIYILYGAQFAQAKEVAIETLPQLLMGIVVTNGIPEAIATGLVVPIIASVLLRLMQKRNASKRTVS